MSESRKDPDIGHPAPGNAELSYRGEDVSQTMPVRFGVLGNAQIFRDAVLPSMLATDRAVLVAIASSSREVHLEDASVRIYSGAKAYQELLEDANVDAVYIPLPNHLHKTWTLRAAAAGKHVLCEKPLGTDAAEAAEMLSACRSNGVHLVEAFMYRYNPQHERAREILASGEIGDLRLVRAGFTVPLERPGENIRFLPERGAGALPDVGIYCINLARWMVGAEPTRAHAFLADLPGTEADILHVVNLEFAGGRLGTISAGLGQGYRSFYELVGTRGRIEVERPFATPPFVQSSGDLILKVETEVGDREGAHPLTSSRTESFPDLNQYNLQMEQFCRLIAGDHNTAYPAEDSVKTLRVVDACFASAKSGCAERVAH